MDGWILGPGPELSKGRLQFYPRGISQTVHVEVDKLNVYFHETELVIIRTMGRNHSGFGEFHIGQV